MSVYRLAVDSACLSSSVTAASAAEAARFVRSGMPSGGLFAGHEWRVSPAPFRLEPALAKDLESLGRVLLQFYRAVNLLYRKSAEGKQPEWIARWLDLGKPAALIELQRSAALKNDVPRVIRPDLILTEHGPSVTELDSVPGGIGLTAWLNQVYSQLPIADSQSHTASSEPAIAESAVKSPTSEPSTVGYQPSAISNRPSAVGNQPSAIGDQPSAVGSQPSAIGYRRSAILGGAETMLRGFAGIFGEAKHVHIVVSEEAATYRPEMEWLAAQLGLRFSVRSAQFDDFADGDAVYRFFELFDLAHVPNARKLFELVAARKIRLTPPPKPIFEEKMLFALLWNRNLRGFWRQELGESFFQRLLRLTPYTWIVDPAPLPPQAAIPELNLTDWQQLKLLSQKERDLILKVSGFSPHAWGARGVFLGNDLSHADWASAVDAALAGFNHSPYVLQRYHKPALVEAQWFDFEKNVVVPMPGRARLCPYYFVSGDGDAARAQLGGVLATINPADKKIIHGMAEAVFAPCAA